MTSNIPIIKTDRLSLSEICYSDVDSLVEILKDLNLRRYYNIAPVATKSDVAKMIRSNDLLNAQGRGMRWGIRCKDSLIGSIGFDSISRPHRAALSFELSRKMWGQGYGAEAVQAVTEFGFQRMHLHRIEAYVLPGNQRSAKLLDKCGFSHEGTLVDVSYLFGKYHTQMVFARISRESLYCEV